MVVGLEKMDALNRVRWRVEVGEIAVYRDKTVSELDDDDDDEWCKMLQ